MRSQKPALRATRPVARPFSRELDRRPDPDPDPDPGAEPSADPRAEPRHAAADTAESWSLPGYVVEELLGSGSSGDVWRARVRTNRQAVALKRVWVDSTEHRRQALREAQLLARLDHPHLIRLRESVARRMSVVLVLDLAEHGSLAGILQRRARLSVGEATSSLALVASALAHAHEQGVVHGDVTPANVLFGGESIPLLADLGVARIVGETEPARTTAGYLDPAVARGALPVPASDVFMLAATAVHALTGRPLWTSTSFEGALAEARAATDDDIESRLVGVPPVVRSVLARGLSTDPYRRPSATVFAQELALIGPPIAVDVLAGRQPAAPALSGGGHRPRHAAPVRREAARASTARRGIQPVNGQPVNGQPPDVQPLWGRRLWCPRSSRARFDGARFEHPRLRASQFDRPAPNGVTLRPVDRSVEPVTHGVRIPAASLPPRHLRRLRTALPLAGPARAATTAVAVAVLASGGWLYVQRSSPADAAAHPRPSHSSVLSTSATDPAAAKLTDAPQTGAPLTDAPLTDAQAATVLAGLDALRGQAFASNDTALLGQVYASPALRDQDAALIARLVPEGCGLLGVRTQYSEVRAVSADRSGATITSAATLAPTTLVCAAQVRSAAPASDSTRLKIVVARQGVGGDYRIVSQVRL